MITIQLRFFSVLRDFLPRGIRFPAAGASSWLEVTVSSRRSIKDIIEGLGIPHVEVNHITTMSGNVDFSYHPRNGDRLGIYPEFHHPELQQLPPLHPQPERPLRFILDVHLGRLARNLRLLGFDALYDNSFSDPELAERAAAENRILLSRDRRLLMRKQVVQGLFIRSKAAEEQTREVLKRYDCRREELHPFSRCLKCNGKLVPVAKEKIFHRLPPKVRTWREEFVHCPSCDSIYWHGTHHARLGKLLENLERFCEGLQRAAQEE